MSDTDTITLSAFPPGEREFIKADGIEIAIVNHDGEYHAFRNWCPHMGAPLGKGPVSSSDETECDDTLVSCPFHTWQFDLESGSATFGDLQIATFDVAQEEDTLHLHLS